MSGFQHISGVAAKIVLDLQLRMILRQRSLSDREIERIVAEVNAKERPKDRRASIGPSNQDEAA